MKIAIVTDIHGNLHALEAVLEDIETQQVDQIIIAGDVVNILPFSKACWDIVSQLDYVLLKGNHEVYIYTYNTPDADPAWQGERFQSLKWFHSLFSSEDIAQMRALPTYFAASGLFITHATSRSLWESVSEKTPEDELDAMFPEKNVQLIMRGHNHSWLERHWNKKTLLTIASCGLPFRGSTDAQYAIATKNKTWTYEKRFVPYNQKALLDAMNEEYLENVGPFALLHRHEVETGQNYLMPFLREYVVAVDKQEISLGTAVNQYLLNRDGFVWQP